MPGDNVNINLNCPCQTALPNPSTISTSGLNNKLIKLFLYTFNVFKPPFYPRLKIGRFTLITSRYFISVLLISSFCNCLNSICISHRLFFETNKTQNRQQQNHFLLQSITICLKSFQFSITVTCNIHFDLRFSVQTNENPSWILNYLIDV